jgi:uncharacterized delta-60 repeat protein
MFESLERRSLFAVTVDVTFPVVEALPPDDPDLSARPGFLDVLSSGKVVVGGVIDPLGTAQFRLARYNADGTPDATFGGGDGLSPLIGSLTGVPIIFTVVDGVTQSDGKTVLATATQTGFAIARYNADGSVDTSFGGGDGLATVEGLIDTDAGGMGSPHVAVTTDGDIVVIGNRGRETGLNEATELHVIRLTADGALDTTFNDDGKLAITPQTIESTANKVRAFEVSAVAGGKVVILTELGDPDNFNRRPALIQLTAAGDFDTGFSGDGKLPFEFTVDANGDEAGDMLVQDDGRIVVVGSDTGHTTITRFNADGTRDTGFGTGGVGFADVASQREPYHLTIDNDGNFVVAISQAITRFTAAGDADTQFAPGGTDQGFTNADLIDFDAQNRAMIVAGGALKRLFMTAADRPDIALGAEGTLIITGETGDNTITIARSGQNIVVTRNGVQSTFAANDVANLDIVTFDGDDTVTNSTDVAAKIDVGDGANNVTVADGVATITGGDGVDHITAGDGLHLLVEAGGGNDSVTLGDGGNVVLGGAGNDTITTGEGNDEIYGEAGSDFVDAGAGNDTVFGGRRVDNLTSGNLSDGGEPDGQNVLLGGDGSDLLVGAGNRDTLRGGAREDTLLGFAGSDLLSGGGGGDNLDGMGGNDRLYGGTGNDHLVGGNHNDRMSGGDGNDGFLGGNGVDVLHGDTGNDIFLTADQTFADSVDGGDGDNVVLNFDDIDQILNATKSA